MDEDFSGWIGRSEQQIDRLDPARSNALRAALGDTTARADGAALPLLYHWLYFWEVRPPEGLGVDGHPRRGGFLPPVPLPRRMWAGGRLTFIKPLLLGERVTRTSTIRAVTAKSGKSGDLVFVTVEHALAGEGGSAIVEEQDIVYREAATAAIGARAGAASPALAPWRRDVFPDPTLLFRYSALTMNGHRIHYDRPYAIEEEAYPGLVVHGPMQATLLIALAGEQLAAPITRFEYRGQAPAFDGAMLHVCGEPTATGASLWTEQGGAKAMIATATCAGGR